MTQLYKKPCMSCGVEFEGRKRRLYCSKPCQAEGLKQKTAEGNARRRDQVVAERGCCPTCKQLWPRNRGPAPWLTNETSATVI